jgi:hypothetical protein
MTSPNAMPTSPQDLGPKQAEFRASGWGRTGLGCLGMICAGIGVAGFIGIAVALVNGRGTKRLAALVAFACLFLVGGIALLRGMRKAGRTRVEVHAGGLALYDGAEVISCRWTEILAVTEKEAVTGGEVIQEAMIHESRAFRLRLQSGEEIALKSYISGLAKLGAIVQRETLPHLKQHCQAELKEKRSIEFGPISLRVEGIEVQQELLPWAEVVGVERKKGWIEVQRLGASKSCKQVKLSDVPNAHVLLDLVAQRLGT